MKQIIFGVIYVIFFVKLFSWFN